MSFLRLLSCLTVLGFAVHHAAVSEARAQTPPLTEKINAAVGCLNRLSERSYQSRERYFSWAARTGPTGKERIIYGTYTIYDTSDCKKAVDKASAIEPREPELEAASAAYVEAVVALEPLLKEANDYYDQQNYKDDKMAKGKALHPRLVAAWATFAAADQRLRASIDFFEDKLAVARLAEVEMSEGKNARFQVMSLMLNAKRLVRIQKEGAPDIAKVTTALAAYEASVKATEEFAAANKDSKIGSMFISNAKSFLTTSKQLMRRVRDKVPYSSGEKMILNSGGGGGWMVEGSPQRLIRDYNQLIDAFNRGANI